MIAGSDGNVDRKEIQVLKKTLTSIGQHPNALFQMSLLLMIPELEKAFDEYVNTPLVPIRLAAELVRMNKMVRQHFPEDAKGFATALYDFGVKIASASGGVFGFGNKISKKEEEVLRIIKGALEL